jgi:hypothetical protein
MIVINLYINTRLDTDYVKRVASPGQHENCIDSPKYTRGL